MRVSRSRSSDAKPAIVFARARLSTVLTCAFTLVACGNGDGTQGDPGIAASAILFVQRAHTTVGEDGKVNVEVSSGNGQVVDYKRYVPGGSLNLLSPPRADGTVANLTADYPTADFSGVDVSFDAAQAVFSMKKDADDSYHLYTVQLTRGADGKYEIHQKTGGDSDDINPVYAQGGRIAFATNRPYTEMGTRADEYEHDRAVTQLATISADGGDADLRLFSQNLSHTVAPFLRHDGKIGYSRWEHLGPVNDVKIFSVKPDGTDMFAVAGQHGKPANSLFSLKETAPNVMVGVATTRNRTIHAGTLVEVDARNHDDPVCLDANANQSGHACVDEERASFTVLSPDVPTGNDPSPAGRYREPSVLPDGRILVSWADGPVNDISDQSLTAPDFGIYVFDPKTKRNQLVFNDRTKWDLSAVAVAPHPEPPPLEETQRSSSSGEAAVIGSIDVTDTSLRDERISGAQFDNTPLPDALKEATHVRIIEGFSSEGAKDVTMFGLTMHEGAAVVGEAKVDPVTHGWLAKIPPYLPVHLQPIDRFGLAIRSQGTWIQAVPGENRRCKGCHESRTSTVIPPATGSNLTPLVEDFASARGKPLTSKDRLETPWDKNDIAGRDYVQRVLNDKCVSCHSGANNVTPGSYTVAVSDAMSGANRSYPIPYFDLSDTPIEAYYDRRVQSWPTSYVSIFYPAAMEMGRTTVTGNVPKKKWGVPGSARASALIEKINLVADSDPPVVTGPRPPQNPKAWANKPLHPEDVGGSLTMAEQRLLVLVMDLGGQFYARQNTQFVPWSGSDPVAPSTQY